MFLTRRPLLASPIEFLCNHSSPSKSLALLQDVSKMLNKETLEVVNDQPPGLYSYFFLVEKASGGWRPVIDLSVLNDFIQQTLLRMETAPWVVNYIREGDFMALTDLKDTYFQVPIHCPSWRYSTCALSARGPLTNSRFFVLDFRWLLRHSPVLTVVLSWAHSRGICLLHYQDDWFILASSMDQLIEDLDKLLSLCQQLGIVMNREKSELVPRQWIIYLGMLIDSIAVRVFHIDSGTKLREIVECFLCQDFPPARLWQVLLGHMSSVEKLSPTVIFSWDHFSFSEWWSVSPSSPQPPDQGRPCLMSWHWSPTSWSSSFSGSFIEAVLRCVAGAVGSSSPGSFYLRNMVPGTKMPSHQSA